MVNFEDILLILLGAGISLFVSLFLFLLKELLDERKLKSRTMKKILTETKFNHYLLDRPPQEFVFLLDETIKQAIVSGKINTIKENLIDLIITLRGDIFLFNQELKSIRNLEELQRVDASELFNTKIFSLVKDQIIDLTVLLEDELGRVKSS